MENTAVNTQVTRDAQFYRVFYRIQELLSREFGGYYVSSEQFGVRAKSSLPPALNSYAVEITKLIMGEHREKQSINLQLAQCNVEFFASELDKLSAEDKMFMDYDVPADSMYLVLVDTNNDNIIGGTGLKKDGELHHFFVHEQRIGNGSKLIEEIKNIAVNGATFTLSCLGMSRMKFFQSHGFEITSFSEGIRELLEGTSESYMWDSVDDDSLPMYFKMLYKKGEK